MFVHHETHGKFPCVSHQQPINDLHSNNKLLVKMTQTKFYESVFMLYNVSVCLSLYGVTTSDNDVLGVFIMKVFEKKAMCNWIIWHNIASETAFLCPKTPKAFTHSRQCPLAISFAEINECNFRNCDTNLGLMTA